jgi:hypothetical protein
VPALTLAGMAGAKVRASLTARPGAIRARQLAGARAAARARPGGCRCRSLSCCSSGFLRSRMSSPAHGSRRLPPTGGRQAALPSVRRQRSRPGCAGANPMGSGFLLHWAIRVGTSRTNPVSARGRLGGRNSPFTVGEPGNPSLASASSRDLRGSGGMPKSLIVRAELVDLVRQHDGGTPPGLGSRILRFVTAAPASFCRWLTPEGADGMLAHAVRTRRVPLWLRRSAGSPRCRPAFRRTAASRPGGWHAGWPASDRAGARPASACCRAGKP